MRKYFLLFIVLSLALCLSAQQPKSMRNIATDGIFTADWDYIFNPIYLGLSDSVYFFTNMSDFSYKYNDMLDDVNESSETSFLEELPLGIAFNNPFLKNMRHAFYVRFMNNLTPDPEIAETESYTTYYEDSDGDDLYDHKTITYDYKIDNEEDKQHLDFIWNNHYKFDNWNLGFKFSSFYICENFDDASIEMGSNDFDPLNYLEGVNNGDNNLDYYKEFYDLEENELYYHITETGDFNTEISDNQKKLLLSVDFENDFLIRDSRLCFNLGYDYHKDLSKEVNDNYSASYSYIYADSLADTGSINDSNNIEQVVNQNHVYLSSRLKKGLETSYGKYTGFYEFVLSGGMISGDSEKSSNRTISSEKVQNDTIPENVVTDEYYDNSFTNEEGEHTGFDLKSHFRMNLPLNNYAIFGLACYYSYTYLNYQLDYTDQYENISTTTIGPAFDDEFDVTCSSTEFLTAEKESIKQNSCLRIPIALEFKIDDDHLSKFDVFSLRNFVYRIGTTFIYNTQNIENTYNNVEHHPNFSITEYGDGTVYEGHDAENTLNSEKTITKSSESLKRFSAGIGYKHSDNVRIDLASYYDCNTEEFYFGLSFTIKK